jgi:anti-anti-sigma factor
MSLTATLTTAGRTAVIALTGSLDAAGDAAFREKIDRVSSLDLTELVIDMAGLTQLSAAGIRAVAYARQRMADDILLVVASPSEQARGALLDADFSDSVAIRE